MPRAGAQSNGSETSSHIQSSVDYITGTHESFGSDRWPDSTFQAAERDLLLLHETCRLYQPATGFSVRAPETPLYA
jgi:hypothetical protein